MLVVCAMDPERSMTAAALKCPKEIVTVKETPRMPLGYAEVLAQLIRITTAFAMTPVSYTHLTLPTKA